MFVGDEQALDLTVGDLVRLQAEDQPDRGFVTTPDGRSHTFADVHLAANRLAAALADLGVRPGDHVGMLLPNDLPILLTWFALARLGAVEVPYNTAFRGSSLEYLVRHSDVEVLVVDQRFVGNLLHLGHRLPALRHVVVVSDDLPDLPWPSARFADLLDAGSPAERDAVADPDSLLAILYTSGTTGHPKGVMESHRCAAHWGRNYRRYMAVGPDDANFLFPPLHHAMSQFLGVVPALQTGSRVVVADGFSASRFWADCRAHGVTLFNFTGGVLSFLWKQPPRPDDRANAVTRALGVPIPDDLYPGFEERFGLSLLPPFGTSESNVVCYSRPGEVRAGSSGRPVPEFEVAVADDEGRLLPPGERGEILTRPREPDSMMRGYYKQPELTARVLRDLWYHTGDMGRLDEDGYLYFLDRKKDAIRRRGENISSFEIERVVNAHPGVLESVAVGVPSEHGEEEVKLAVVPMPGAELTVEGLWAFCDAELPAFMVPRYVELRDALPKTPTERVQKFVIRDEGVHAGVHDREGLAMGR